MNVKELIYLLRTGKVKIRLPKDNFVNEKGWIGKDDLEGKEINRKKMKELFRELAKEL